MIQAKIMDNQVNIQSTHDGEIVGEGVVELEEDAIVEECGPPHEIELPQERSFTEEDKTIDSGEVIEVVERKERLLIKKENKKLNYACSQLRAVFTRHCELCQFRILLSV